MIQTFYSLQIGSGFIIGFGIQTLVELSFTASVIGTNTIIYCPYLLISVGILSFVMTPVGFYSIILNDNKVMVTHMFATFFLGALCAISAFLGYKLNVHVSSVEMENYMKHSIKEEYGNPIAPYIATEWNQAHQQVFFVSWCLWCQFLFVLSSNVVVLVVWTILSKVNGS